MRKSIHEHSRWRSLTHQFHPSPSWLALLYLHPALSSLPGNGWFGVPGRGNALAKTRPPAPLSTESASTHTFGADQWTKTGRAALSGSKFLSEDVTEHSSAVEKHREGHASAPARGDTPIESRIIQVQRSSSFSLSKRPTRACAIT